MFFRVNIALKVVGTSPGRPTAGQAHILLAVPKHGGPLGLGGGKVIVGLASMSNRIYKGLSDC